MLRIAIIETSAERRNRLNEHIQDLVNSEVREVELLPRISLMPALFDEIRLLGSPDIIIVGPGVAERDVSLIREVRENAPSSSILAFLLSGMQTLALVEQVARMGADDTCTEKTTAEEFFRKLVLLARRTPKKEGGRLVLIDSGKGGLGVTTIAAGLGEALLDNGKRVSLVDLDSDSQDLSRFLQARPYVNEPLQLLLEQKRPTTEEMVRQALVNIWADEYDLLCMPPAPDDENSADMQAIHARVWISILELVETVSDVTIVDVANARGPVLKTLYRVADTVIFVVNNDPASIFAAADKVVKAKGWMSAGAELFIVNNSSHPHGLPSSVLVDELCSATKIERSSFVANFGFDAGASKWPASGATPFSLGKSKTRAAFLALACKVVPELELAKPPAFETKLGWFDQIAVKLFGKKPLPPLTRGPLAGAMLDSRIGMSLPAPEDISAREEAAFSSAPAAVQNSNLNKVPSAPLEPRRPSGVSAPVFKQSRPAAEDTKADIESRNDSRIQRKLVSGAVFK